MVETLANPFARASKGPNAPPSIKFAIWEVLKDYCGGLNANQIVFRIEQRGLKDFTGKRNAVGQVSGDLVRHPNHFVRDPAQKVWFVKPLAPASLLEDLMVTRSKTKRAKPAPKLPPVTEPLPEKKPRGRTLVGARVSVWWAGDNKFFNGEIVAYEPEADSYTVIYDDGDADNGIRFRNYEVVWCGLHVQLVRVYETDQDEIEVAGTAITKWTWVNGTEQVNGCTRSAPNALGDGMCSGDGQDLVSASAPVCAPDGAEAEVAEVEDCDQAGLKRQRTFVKRMRGGHRKELMRKPGRPAKRDSNVRNSQLLPTSNGLSSSLCGVSTESGKDMYLAEAVKCADLISRTLSLYRTQQVEMTDSYNVMRGENSYPLVDSTLLGEIGERVEGTGWDVGLFALPMQSEASGIKRFSRFCVESFTKTTKGIDSQLYLILEFGEEKARQLMNYAKARRLSQIQAVVNATTTMPGDNIVERLRLVEQQIREIATMMSGT